jgi:putative flavoprotein involved in K+ transport
VGPRVLIVGGGPAGLATAAALAARAIGARVVDRHGVAGGAYARMDPDIVMTTPSALVSLPGLRAPHGEPYLRTGAYGAYLREYARRTGVTVEPRRVTALERGERGYRVTMTIADDADDADASATANANTAASANADANAGASASTIVDVAIVVLATGMFDHPVRPVLAGLPADGAATPARPRVVHAADWRIADARAGERVLILGGASSAVEIAEACARAGSLVTVSARHGVAITRETIAGVDPTRVLMPLLGRLPPSLARGFCAGRRAVPATDRGFGALRRAGTITVVGALARLDGRTAIVGDGRRLAVDVVVLATGYRYANLPAPADLARDERGVPRTRDGESVSHRGLFVIGAPCVRRAASQYLYGMARDAPAIADTIARRLGQRTL